MESRRGGTSEVLHHIEEEGLAPGRAGNPSCLWGLEIRGSIESLQRSYRRQYTTRCCNLCQGQRVHHRTAWPHLC